MNETTMLFDSLSHVFLCCIYCCPISTGVSPPTLPPFPGTITTPPFPFLFLSVLPSERPPIGFGGSRRLCRIIMGSSWENCPRKGSPGKKRGGGQEKNLVLFPILLGNIHQKEFGCLRGRSSPAAGAPNRSCHCTAASTVSAGGSDAHQRDRCYYVSRALMKVCCHQTTLFFF